MSPAILAYIFATSPEPVHIFYSRVGEGPDLFCVTFALYVGEWQRLITLAVLSHVDLRCKYYVQRMMFIGKYSD